MQESIMKEDIQYAKTIADVVIVSLHWARLPQYVKEADTGKIERCHRLCDWGADILTNHGPHVLQEVELYKNSLIFYSLGNTVFDLVNKDSHYSAIAILHMDGDGKDFESLELVPIIKNEYNQYIAQGNILDVAITDGLYLNWDDYNSKMFNNDKLLTDYSGPKEDSDPLFSDRIMAVILIFGIVLAILFVVYFYRKRKKAKK